MPANVPVSDVVIPDNSSHLSKLKDPQFPQQSESAPSQASPKPQFHQSRVSQSLSSSPQSSSKLRPATSRSGRPAFRVSKIQQGGHQNLSLIKPAPSTSDITLSNLLTAASVSSSPTQTSETPNSLNQSEVSCNIPNEGQSSSHSNYAHPLRLQSSSHVPQVNFSNCGQANQTINGPVQSGTSPASTPNIPPSSDRQLVNTLTSLLAENQRLQSEMLKLLQNKSSPEKNIQSSTPQPPKTPSTPIISSTTKTRTTEVSSKTDTSTKQPVQSQHGSAFVYNRFKDGGQAYLTCFRGVSLDEQQRFLVDLKKMAPFRTVLRSKDVFILRLESLPVAVQVLAKLGPRYGIVKFKHPAPTIMKYVEATNCRIQDKFPVVEATSIC
eukprot:733097_1